MNLNYHTFHNLIGMEVYNSILLKRIEKMNSIRHSEYGGGFVTNLSLYTSTHANSSTLLN